MGPVALGVAAAASALLFFGGWRGYRFMHSIMTYRERTKAETFAATDKFLHLGAGGFSAPLHFFRINDEVMGGRSSALTPDPVTFHHTPAPPAHR